MAFDTGLTYIASNCSPLVIVCIIITEFLNSLESLLVLHPLRSTSAVGGAIFASHAKSPTTFTGGTSTAFDLSLMADIASQPKTFLSGSNTERRGIHCAGIAAPGFVGWAQTTHVSLYLSNGRRPQQIPNEKSESAILSVHVANPSRSTQAPFIIPNLIDKAKSGICSS